MSETDNQTKQQTDKTHFGFEQVDTADKARRVRDVFHSVASKYDIMNDVMSLGVHRIWKHLTIAATGVKSGDIVLDLAGGTGDLTSKISPKVGRLGQVVLADINASMLQEGRNRLLNEGKIDNITYVQVNAEALPFSDNTFDVITMAFGLRNVTDKDKALRSMLRVLKPGGRLYVLEFSKPTNELFSKVYDAYSFYVLPKMGQLIAGDGDSYKYLAESIRMHPDQVTLQAMMYEAGFSKVEYENMTQGAVALHIATKPA